MMSKFANDRMANQATHTKRIGNDIKRSSRNHWAENLENLVRNSCPFPISYDVSQTQSTAFTEYTYTELAGGMWVTTQSLEVNCRLFELASKTPTDQDLSEFALSLSDKYNLGTVPDKFAGAKRVCFLPGHNMLDVASVELIARITHEEEDVVFKPHPITNDDAIRLVGRRVGWNRLVPREASGHKMLVDCEEVFTTTASEIAITATALGKKVVNISNFFNEGSGAYHAISRILFRAHKHSVELAMQELANIVHCEWSGLLFPWQNDINNRLNSFYEKSLELRDMYRVLASPRGNINQESKEVQPNVKS